MGAPTTGEPSLAGLAVPGLAPSTEPAPSLPPAGPASPPAIPFSVPAPPGSWKSGTVVLLGPASSPPQPNAALNTASAASVWRGLSRLLVRGEELAWSVL